ncbi:N-acyl homoserine lactonase family protein [Nocardioides sp.]|uniref:N-acyl homoserine lactonase family protein n=1 Tax=Nocardioides sp. TaxID=35761 RepID=UPI003785291F
MAVNRIVLLTLGWEDLPKSYSVFGADPRERLREPTPGILLETDAGWILLDTGFNTALVRDPYLRERFYPDADYLPVVAEEGEPLVEALQGAGLAVPDITAIALSHLHSDHAGGLKLFGADVPVHIQRKELDFGLNDPRAEADGVFRVDFDDPRIDWVLIDGDAEIAPGVRAVATPGHTPGHQSFVVDLAGGQGGYVFAFDAADLTENIDHERPIGSFIDVTADETVAPIRRLKQIAQETGYRLVPGHDPLVWPALSGELATLTPASRGEQGT